MLDLKALREKLKEQEERKNNFNGDNVLYRLWEIPQNERAVLRFLPDADEDNPFFWVKREMIKLPFDGTTNDMNEKVVITVPCIEMYVQPNGKIRRCPIMQELRRMFRAKDPDLEEKAKKYWKKVSYLFQGFVVHSPFEEEEKPENPIRRFIINKQLFSVIKGGLMDPEIEVIPIDYERGRDFYVIKSKQGDYASYIQSKWSIKERALTDEELEAIETYGLWNLKDFLPEEPTDEEISDYYEMFEASIMGQPFDEERWGKYRFGNNGNSDQTVNFKRTSNKRASILEENDEEKSNVMQKLKTVSKKEVENIVKSEIDEDDEEENSTSEKTKTDPKEIIALLKKRKGKK